MRLAPSVREWLFRAAAVGAALSAAFHAAAMISPAIARIEYEPTYPLWSHVVFIFIDSALVWLFLRRPSWLVWAVALLTVQTLAGHGCGAWRLWVEQGRVDWISVAVSIGTPAVLLLLFLDWRDRRRGG